ncbi:MAG: LPD7 domain-containing protein [Pseudorhodoplanes sp.]|jgi:hypothetical protein|nr:LPD7 domain-containing protein [Pseudorhodoplanes sp.]
MITGFCVHSGGTALARHLARHDNNESVSVATRGLAADTIKDGITELGLMSRGCGTKKPLIHVWASPTRLYSKGGWSRYWARFEKEFGLELQPYVEVTHIKLGLGGRTAEHKHRVYVRIRPDRTAIPYSHSHKRMEKLSRLAELDAGEPLTKGRHSRAVVKALERQGLELEAQALVNAGLTTGPLPVAPSPAERAAAEQKEDLAPDAIWMRAHSAWCRSNDAASFVAALQAEGLSIAEGSRGPVLVGPRGSVTSLRRAVSNGARRAGCDSVRKSDIRQRIADHILPALDDVLKSQPACPVDQLFSIVGLDRSIPVPDPKYPSAQVEENHSWSFANAAEPTSFDAPTTEDILLTPAQMAAAQAFEDALAYGSAEFAQKVLREIEAELATAQQEKIAEDKDLAQHLRQRVARLGGDPALPAIGIPGWRDAFKADLARLPRKIGPVLRWVEQREAGCCKITLRSGVTVITMPDRAVADQATDETVSVMISHAHARGWQEITVTGGTPEWREAITRAATRAGIAVVNHDLKLVEEEERQIMRKEMALELVNDGRMPGNR